jgi:hypothetical protein
MDFQSVSPAARRVKNPSTCGDGFKSRPTFRLVPALAAQTFQDLITRQLAAPFIPQAEAQWGGGVGGVGGKVSL